MEIQNVSRRSKLKGPEKVNEENNNINDIKDSWKEGGWWKEKK